jgi:hypothetical protein
MPENYSQKCPVGPTSRNTPTGGNRIAKTILIGSAAVTAIEYHLLSGVNKFLSDRRRVRGPRSGTACGLSGKT